MYRIGLTGGIASGKSTVVQMLRRLGASVVDCDVLARKAAEPGSEGLAAVAAAFGPKALRSDGSMDRAYVGSIVFADASKKAELEGILFPFIYKAIDEEMARIERDEHQTVVFLDMPLLFEIEYQAYVDEVWLVYVDRPTQLARLMERNHFTEQEALSRMDAQLPAEEKISRSRVIIDNMGTLAQTKEQVCRQWDSLQLRLGKLVGDGSETKTSWNR